jgi:hypothetical protein
MINKIQAAASAVAGVVWSNIAMGRLMLRPVSDHTTGIIRSCTTRARKDSTAFYSSLVSRLIEFSGFAM